MGRVIHFEISVDDTKKAVAFYKKVFGWKIEKWGGEGMEYWLVSTGEKSAPGIDGAIMPREKDFPPTVNTIAVDDLDKAMKDVKAAGGKVVSKKNEIPKVGWFCYCLDADGNMFGMLQQTGTM
ncbi:MAG TPA: VOC family protein [Methanomassiliicoccales archaeon]|jgi:predicted enzyme related to lactoylglutathione lyase|nr:VOC family protein [Methanomassiliicoccales archaeon]